MSPRVLILLALGLASCGLPWAIVGPDTTKEGAFVAEVDRCARVLRVDVRGRISPERLSASCDKGTLGPGECLACGWFANATAFGADWCLARDSVDALQLADHETAHALVRDHGEAFEAVVRRCGPVGSVPDVVLR